jgi:hypothetical protein
MIATSPSAAASIAGMASRSGAASRRRSARCAAGRTLDVGEHASLAERLE